VGSGADSMARPTHSCIFAAVFWLILHVSLALSSDDRDLLDAVTRLAEEEGGKYVLVDDLPRLNQAQNVEMHARRRGVAKCPCDTLDGICVASKCTHERSLVGYVDESADAKAVSSGRVIMSDGESSMHEKKRGQPSEMDVLSDKEHERSSLADRM
jgi:hypothetical protein